MPLSMAPKAQVDSNHSRRGREAAAFKLGLRFFFFFLICLSAGPGFGKRYLSFFYCVRPRASPLFSFSSESRLLYNLLVSGHWVWQTIFVFLLLRPSTSIPTFILFHFGVASVTEEKNLLVSGPWVWQTHLSFFYCPSTSIPTFFFQL
jgi:hypothetical protein